MVRFSENKNCRIVELYRQHECLWNPKHVNYRDRQLKQSTWELITHQMNIEGFTVADAKNKIKSLRGTHNIEVLKMKKQFEAGNFNHRPNMKWFSIMDSFIGKLENRPKYQLKPPSVAKGENKPEGNFPDHSQLEQHAQSNSEIASAPSMPSESEIEQSIQSIIDPEVITITPEIHSVRSVSNPEVYSVIPEVQGTEQVPHSQVVTVTPEILTVKAVSEPGVTSEIKTVQSVSSPGTTTATSGIPQTVTSASTPKLYALIPEIRTSNSISSPKFVTISAGSNQSVKYVPNSPVFAVSPETQQRAQSASADNTPTASKRRHEENRSNDSNTEFAQRMPSEDELDAFGRFVALNLRKMTMKSSLSAQSEILTILTHFRILDSTMNPPSEQTSYIVTNGGSPTQNPVVLQKVFLKR